jgi:hypothetical protein
VYKIFKKYLFEVFSIYTLSMKFLSLWLLTLSAYANTVMFIGDSQSVGPFGKKLDSLLRENSHAVASYASCGSIGQWWTGSTRTKTTCGYFRKNLKGEVKEVNSFPTPSLASLLDANKPDVVILQFGGNYRAFNDPTGRWADQYNPAFIKKDVQSLIDQVKKTGARCFFVTGPDTRKDRDLLNKTLPMIQEQVGTQCGFFLSTKVTRYPDTCKIPKECDGYHYSFKAGIPIAQQWAELVHKEIENYLTNSL